MNDEMKIFSQLMVEMSGQKDRGASFPQSDVDDFGKGVRFVPGDVTMARRGGEQVIFVQLCHMQTCWYWEFEGGTRTYHWEGGDYRAIAEHNGKIADDNGSYSDGAGACQHCGNKYTNGGRTDE